MAKLPTPTGEPLDYGQTNIVYAGGVGEGDQFGPNTHLVFWMAQRITGEREPAKKVVVTRTLPVST
jgi:hypothetical protein